MRSSTRRIGPWVCRAAALVGVVGLSAGGASAQAPSTKPKADRPTQPATRPIPEPPPRLGDRDVESAIKRGLAFLFKIQKPDGTWQTRYSRAHEGGFEALVAMTALSAGRDAEDAKLKATLRYLTQLDPKTVYVRAMRAMVCARLPKAAHGARLAADAAWLLRNQNRTGGWGYGPGHRATKARPDWTDASNTQLAVLALRDAADAGATVSPAAWQRIHQYWTAAQNSDGGWGYEPPGRSVARLRGSSHGSMTAAGLASMLMVIQKRGWAPPAVGAKESADHAVVQRALAWLAQRYTVKAVPGWVWGTGEQWPYYYLWGLARACNHAGARNLGTHDWYPDLAAEVLSRQRPDGSWSTVSGDANPTDAPVRTCFALLSLLESRAAILVNELGGRAGAPAAVGNLVRWIGGTFKRPTAWQAIQAADSQAVFSEAPILFVNVRAAAELPKLPAAKIRGFVLDGGTVAANVAVPASPTLVEAVQKYFVNLFAEYEYTAAPIADAHPVWDVYYKVAAGARPGAIGIGDHCRTRVFVLPDDLARAWDSPATAGSLAARQFGVNMLYYTTDMQRPKGRLAARRGSAFKGTPTRAVVVARVRHAGGWSSCPRALPQLSGVLTQALSLAIHTGPPVDLSQDVPPGISALWMTGSADPKLTQAQADRLRKYVQAGGMLFVDSTVGREEFTRAVVAVLEAAFGAGALKQIPPDHPLLTGKFAGGAGSDVRQVRYTRAAAGTVTDKRISGLMGVELDGRLAVILSRYGVTCPVEGLATYGCVGLATDDARRLAANVVLYAIMGP